MTLFILAYAAGLLTIATPCILPVLPFVLARAGLPFRRGGLPMLLGLAIAFASVASTASVAGRSEEARAGQGCVLTSRSWWSPINKKKKNQQENHRRILTNLLLN